MDLNRETAMRLLSKSFGKKTKVRDFTGREIAKGAYKGVTIRENRRRRIACACFLAFLR